MKISLVALLACCAIAGNAMAGVRTAFTDDPGVRPPQLTDDPGVRPPQLTDDPGVRPPQFALSR